MKNMYCTQNNGYCDTCSLVNYGCDCHNNTIAIVVDGYCQCGYPIIYCNIHKTNHTESGRARMAAAKATEAPVDQVAFNDFFRKEGYHERIRNKMLWGEG